MKLVIVESPTKAKTISRFLKKGYQLVASQGHVRDLPRQRLGVKIEKTKTGWRFSPQYQILAQKRPLLKKIKDLARRAEVVILATDPDREGEAIAWHLAYLLGKTTRGKEKKFWRISFHEITAAALKKAFRQPGQINQNLVAAQQARRVLDRLVGYKLSPLLWQKIKRHLSAGRVQSVALRLIVEREKEIENFPRQPFWQPLAAFRFAGHWLVADLWHWRQKAVVIRERQRLFAGNYQFKKTIFSREEDLLALWQNLGQVEVTSRQQRLSAQLPPPPLVTASLQQEAARRWGWSGKLTMAVAQSLYEQGLITYHRTDSFNLSDAFLTASRRFLRQHFGAKYLPPAPRRYQQRSKLAQEAHEAIRPTMPEREIAGNDRRQQRLYQLIWQRSLGSQMAAAKIARVKVDLWDEKAQANWRLEGQQLIFAGYRKIFPNLTLKEKIIPPLKKGQKLNYRFLGAIPQQTAPPPRYSEASLIAALEKEGIGRPSTYAPIISLIQERGYVEKEAKRFKPTRLGVTVSQFLSQHFPKIMSLPFTAGLEADLDAVAAGRQAWMAAVAKFWQPFQAKLARVRKEAARVKVELEKIGEKCPRCQRGELVIRRGRFGKFIACSRYPECKYTRPYLEPAGFKCPRCGAPAVIRYSKKGRRFYGCSRYPECRWASWRRPRETTGQKA